MFWIALDLEDNDFSMSGENSSCYGQLGKTDGRLVLSMASILGPVPEQFCVSNLVVD